MPISQVYISPDTGNTWVPWNGTTLPLALDQVSHSDPGNGLLSNILLPAVADKSYVITGVFGSIIVANPQPRLALRLFANATRLWSTRFLPDPAQVTTLFAASGLNVVMPIGVDVELAWNNAPAAGNFCTCAVTWHLV